VVDTDHLPHRIAAGEGLLQPRELVGVVGPGAVVKVNSLKAVP